MGRSNSTAIAIPAAESFVDIRNYLMLKQKAIENLAPKYLDTERMIRVALGASSRSPQLLQCTPKSWLMALMDCALYGLEPNPQLGHAYLLPFRNNKLPGKPLEVIFVPGYKGLILLAWETMKVRVGTRLVYENELAGEKFYEVPEDPMKPFFHRPIYKVDERGAIAGAYAVGWTDPKLRPDFKFMPVDELEERRKRAPSGKRNDGPWSTDTGAMYKKTAIKGMLAIAPMKPGSTLGTALHQDSALERGEVVRARDWDVGDDDKKTSKIDDLADGLEEQAGAEAQEPTFDTD